MKSGGHSTKRKQPSSAVVEVLRDAACLGEFIVSQIVFAMIIAFYRFHRQEGSQNMKSFHVTKVSPTHPFRDYLLSPSW